MVRYGLVPSGNGIARYGTVGFCIGMVRCRVLCKGIVPSRQVKLNNVSYG